MEGFTVLSSVSFMLTYTKESFPYFIDVCRTMIKYCKKRSHNTQNDIFMVLVLPLTCSPNILMSLFQGCLSVEGMEPLHIFCTSLPFYGST